MRADAAQAGAGLNESLGILLRRTSYFRVGNDKERDAVYRLRYEAYRRENAIGARKDGRFNDHYDDDRNAITFGVTLDGLLAGSIRLHLTSSMHPRGPALDTYGDVLGPLLEAGKSFIDPSRFVTHPTVRRRARLLPFAITRLACLAAEHFRSDWMLASVRLEHAPFYRRFCLLDPMSDLREYPFLDVPLMLLGGQNDQIRDPVFAKHPVFSSTAAERQALFGSATELASIQFDNDNLARSRTSDTESG